MFINIPGQSELVLLTPLYPNTQRRIVLNYCFNIFKYIQIRNKACVGFQPIRHNYAIFSYQFIKVCLRHLRHDLSTHVESGRLVT